MFVPPLGRASLLQPGPSSVPQCRLNHFIVITVLLVATVASDMPQDLCRQNPATFADQIHTIGSIDDELWAIVKNNWNVYKLTPCDPGGESLVHCMKIDPPVDVNTKWPNLAQYVKSAAKEKDLTLPINNSVVMDSSEFGHTVLTMCSDSFKTGYFGFDFGKSNSPFSTGDSQIEKDKGLWISSDVKDKAYRLLDFVQQVDSIIITKPDANSLSIKIYPNSTKYICTDTNGGVQFKESECGSKMDWSLKKGVLYRKQFYFITSDKVYIFSDQAEHFSTKMQAVSFLDFFHCNEPTTMAPPSSARNATNPRVTTNSTPISTTRTAKGSSTTIIIIILGVIVIVLASILTLIFANYFWYISKLPKDVKSDGNSKLASSSPKDSKVITKAPTVSKGSFKQSQNRVKTVAQKVSLGKQMKGSSSN